jgi:hypothetical protein
VDLATTIAETASAKGFFSVPGKSGSASGEYLNLQLGILPVVSDLKDLWTAVETQEKVLQQLERDSGRSVRRRYEFPEQVDTYKTVNNRAIVASLGPALAFGQQCDYGTLTTIRTVTRRTWFSGAFTYYLPKSGWRRTLSQYQRLYGIKPGLETAWNVVPLSFVADYFANTGDVIHNMDTFGRDGLIMPYGYVMSTTVDHTEYSWGGPVSDMSGKLATSNVVGTITRTAKDRMPASPFGFGLNDTDITPRQGSILAALGLSRRK